MVCFQVTRVYGAPAEEDNIPAHMRSEMEAEAKEARERIGSLIKDNNVRFCTSVVVVLSAEKGIEALGTAWSWCADLVGVFAGLHR